jgi:hypothetical protein
LGFFDIRIDGDSNVGGFYNNANLHIYKRMSKMIIPVFIPITEEDLDAIAIDWTDLPTGKQILLFMITLIPVWALVAWLWSIFLCERPFFTDYMLFTNLTFSFLVSTVLNLLLWFMGDAYLMEWIRKRRNR